MQLLPQRATLQAQHRLRIAQPVTLQVQEQRMMQQSNAVYMWTRLGWQQVLRRRKLSRLMLRGDNVVTISLAVGPMRLPSALAHLTPPESSADKAVDTRNVKHEA
jgi:hypothetical protein